MHTKYTHANMTFHYPSLISHVYFSPLFCHAAFVCMDMYNWVCEIDTTLLKLLMLIFLASISTKNKKKNKKFLICLHSFLLNSHFTYTVQHLIITYLNERLSYWNCPLIVPYHVPPPLEGPLYVGCVGGCNASLYYHNKNVKQNTCTSI